VVQPAQGWAAKNGPGQLDGARDRRIVNAFRPVQLLRSDEKVIESGQMMQIGGTRIGRPEDGNDPYTGLKRTVEGNRLRDAATSSISADLH
jgi:hypothetical protein